MQIINYNEKKKKTCHLFQLESSFIYKYNYFLFVIIIFFIQGRSRVNIIFD